MDRRATRAWCFYDWANSAFATTVMAALFPPFFRELAIAAGRGEAEATALWGYVTAGALLLIAVTAPVLGAMADAIGGRKKFLAFLAGLGILATGLFATLGADGWRTAALLYVAANFGFAGSIIFYESLLPSLARGRDMDRLSAQAYGLGYAGGGLLLVINLLWVMHPDWFAMPDRGFAVRASFVSVAVWWGLFSLPLFKYVPEPPVKSLEDGKATGPVLVQGFHRLAATLREITRYRQLLIFLAAYWIYNDGIGTIVKMATAYGSEIGIGMTDLIGALVLTQAIGVPFAILFGRLARRTGPKSAILLALSVYLIISVFGFFLESAAQFYVLAGLVGTVQGGAQALSRSLFASMVPRHRTSEFFGFYSSSGKLAGVAGPLVFGLVSQGTGNSRLGILSLIIFFAVGGWLLTRVDVSAGEAEARRAEKEAGFQEPELS
ncbi:MAG: MFS transporter [Candidatus Krumholzibacteria bacterium]|nr:MFS transporter [Candidatus Krumholzibacteria bacterium]